MKCIDDVGFEEIKKNEIEVIFIFLKRRIHKYMLRLSFLVVVYPQIMFLALYI